MKLRTVLSVGAAALLCAGVGCKKDKAGSDDKAATPDTPKITDTATNSAADTATNPGGSEEAPTSDEPAAATVTVSKGLAEEGNNPKLVELVAAFESCKLKPQNLAYECREALKPFTDAIDKVADAATLFNFLDDPKPHVRAAGALAIANFSLMQNAAGREFGDRLTAAAARETEVAIANVLAPSILQGDFKDAEYSAAVQSLAATHELDEMRAGVISNLPVQDWDTFFPFLKDRLEKEESADVRLAIISSFYTSARKDGACDFFVANLKDADEKVAAKAAYNIVWTTDDCEAKYDDFLAEFESRVKASKADFGYLLLTTYFAQTKKSTDEQKAKFFGFLEEIVADTKVSGLGRAKALETLGEFAPDGKKLAKKYTGDSERFVSDAAKKIAKGK